MRTTLKLVAMLAVTVTLAACGSDDDDDVVFVPTVQPEPVSTKF